MTKGQKGLWICLGGLTVIGGALLALRHEEKKGTKEEPVADKKEVKKVNPSQEDSTPREEEITVPLPKEKAINKKEVNIQPTSKDITKEKKEDALNLKEEKVKIENNTSDKKEEVSTSTEE